MKKYRIFPLIALFIIIATLFSSCELPKTSDYNDDLPISVEDLESIPEFSGKEYAIVNDNIPFFTEDEIVTKSYEKYSELDSLGRCGVAMACVGIDIMPKEDRGDIDGVKPSGWVQASYDCVPGSFLYNRCHLIGFQLTGENDNVKNLITGTKFMNNEGMLPFENMVAKYIKEYENHVMYRISPIFKGNNLVASGVLMEAWSVEDEGEGICLNVYLYNNQPGVRINYATGESKLDDGVPYPPEDDSENNTESAEYIINTSTKKYHLKSCRYATGNNAKPATKEEIEAGEYEACKVCKPDNSN